LEFLKNYQVAAATETFIGTFYFGSHAASQWFKSAEYFHLIFAIMDHSDRNWRIDFSS
jgi:hypothetical protein